jgi:hypothetical protein
MGSRHQVRWPSSVALIVKLGAVDNPALGRCSLRNEARSMAFDIEPSLKPFRYLARRQDALLRAERGNPRPPRA